MDSKNIADCVPELQQAWPKLVAAFRGEFPRYNLVLTCTHRPPEHQLQLFQQGRALQDGKWVVVNQDNVVTNLDGFKLRSFHNDYPARAFDVAVITPKGGMDWNYEDPLWQFLRKIAPSVGLQNGGMWTTLKDYPHFQLL